MTTKLADPPTIPGRDADPTTETERVLAAMLVETAGVGAVPVDGHFFDDLAMDSLVMAQFCARARKRTALPPISIKDVYRHPTIRALAGSLADARATRVEPPVPPAIATAARGASAVGTPRYVLCGALQLLALLAYASVAALGVAAGYEWISAGSGWADVYLRSVVVGATGLLVACVAPIIAKWTLIGRFERRRIRIWSLPYVRFWIVATLIRLSPAVLFAGSPLYVLYLRALGASIGRGAVIFSRNAPVCTDLLTLGASAVIRKDSFFGCYRAAGGLIETGPVTIGDEAIVGEAAVLDIDTGLGDGARLAHASSLHAGAAVPDGERRQGSPADQRAASDLLAVEPADCGTPRRAVYSALQLLGALAASLPLAIGGVYVLVAEVPQLGDLLAPGSAAFGGGSHLIDAAVASLVLLAGSILAGLLVVGTVPRLLNLAIEPDRVYPLYGFHYAIHRAIARLTNVRFFTYLFGDSSCVVHYLRWVGYDLSAVEQTGSNFGLEVKHENPYLSSVGTGTMVADGLSIVNADFSSTSFRASRATIGRRSFIGNWVAYPSQGRTGQNCLLATKAMVPVAGDVRESVGLLGSPSFEIPRSVERDSRIDHLGRGPELRRRLAAKNVHNAGTIGLFLLTRWGYLLGITLLASGAAAIYETAGAAAIATAGALVLPFTVVYQVAVERAATAFRSLRPRFCSIYQPYFWRHERYWKLSTQLPRALNGTPFKALAWRALGVRIGRRVFDDGCLINEKTLVAIGDDCALNARSILQPHSQEDGTFKSDRIGIGAGCTLGVNALVNYGVTIGDGATLAPDSFLMKGTEVPPNTRWGKNPARELAEATARNGRPDADLQASLGVEPDGGFGRIPRWILQPVAGVAEHRAPVPGEVVAAVRRLADEMAVPLSTVLLAAQTRALAALTGEREVVTGYVASAGGLPLPCRLEAEADSWRALLRRARRIETELLSRRASPTDLDATDASFETVLDPTGDGVDAIEDAVLRVGVAERGGEVSLRVAYRTDALDADSAARIAGYHVTALRLIAADPDAEPARQSLLSDEELRFQLDGLAGPQRELPPRRFHELFEERAAADPAVIAAVCGDRQWTYGELNSRANRLGRALLARGLRREEVVAVVSERNLDWMAAVLAVFKAGGVYLPIEPHLPADRIAAMLSRAGCELVLTEPDATARLERAVESLPGVQALPIGEAFEERHCEGDLGVEVEPDQLAYIYFTSGSTGEPKGAMCEHAGVLNHLYAKVDDLGLGEGDVVAQTAPQSFDISLWQLVSALLVGARTLIVEQELILDIEGFVERIADRRVSVLQVVPSYLEVLLTYLEEQPRDLLDLRCVSVTGEALTKELAERWFALEPKVVLVNAYGLTETSDDTNHEVLTGAPDSGRVPLGRPVNNVHVYVVDEHHSPVPLGAPGEIVFSGVCVGRGYVNDPERTRLAFLKDPHRDGQRLYLSGDYGRWLPDGKLEFLGRRDAQVKIRGLRIEIGEVESALSRVPGVRAAAAVVAERSAGAKRLVAFYSGRALEVDALRAAMGESLPISMVPSTFHQRKGLPLTTNGKVDRKALAALAAELDDA